MSTQAAAKGTLGATPLSKLLIYVLDRRLTGTLVLEDAAQQRSAISFRSGAPTKVKLSEPRRLLSEILVTRHGLEVETAASTFEAARAAGKLHGTLLVEKGVVPAATIAEALVEQLAQKLDWLAELPPETVYGYYEQDFLGGYAGSGVEADPLGLVWRVVRKQATPSVVAPVLERLGGRELRLHPKSRVGRFGFGPKERGVVDVLRMKPQPLGDLVASGLLPPAEVQALLYALVLTRHLDLGPGAGRPVGIEPTGPVATGESAERFSHRPPPGVPAAEPAPSPAAPLVAPSLAPPSADAAAFRGEVKELAERIEKMSYFEILAVEPSAPSAAVQAAFFQLAKKWHPDRLAAEFGDLREATMKIFARMTEAHQVLSNEERRREYEKMSKDGEKEAEEQEVVQRVLRAATAFQKAEVLVRRGSLAEAEEQAAIAAESDPEQAEYAALHADLLSQRAERAQSGNYADVLKMVNDAKKRQPDNLRVRLYRARVLRRSGDIDGAYREFRAIVEKDANNVEAAREVRLHEMRRGKTRTTDPHKQGTSADAKNSGKDLGQLFGKLFKR